MTERIDALNTVLIGVAFFIALFVPFHLMLFVYAVLGPLHYLTEIPWLHTHSYFTQKKSDGLVFLGVAASLVLLYVGQFFGSFELSAILIATCFLWSGVCIATSRNDIRLYAFIILSVSSLLLLLLPSALLFFAILIPTLIHVFVFTLLFMLYGARKSKSTIGYINVLLVCVCILLFFIIQKETTVGISLYIAESYEQSFGILHFTIGEMFGKPFENIELMFTSTFGIVLMQCIAFAYTYHYLNWFSKTGVIKWHERVWMYRYPILIFWIISVGLYAYSYVTGLAALYFLSMLHVLMEFPLNMHTIRALGARK